MFFINAKEPITEDQKVTKILGCFENGIIYDWTSNEHERLAKLSYTEFMKEFRKRWLPNNWEQVVHTELMNSRLKPPQSFEDWADQVLLQNVLLQNTASHMNDDQLQIQLAVALDEELRTMASDDTDIAQTTDL